MSKLLERVINNQLLAHFGENNALPESQLAYRVSHSTETALLKITSDALLAADRGMLTLLGLLDLSATFDCVDHSYLPHSIGEVVWINGTVAGLDEILSERQKTTSAVQWSTLQFCRVELRCAPGLRTRSAVFRIVHIGCVQHRASARLLYTWIR